MKTKIMYSIGVIAGLAISFTSCQKETSKTNPAARQAAVYAVGNTSASIGKENTYYGPQVPVGNGKMRTFATLTHEGVPLVVGVEITDSALYNLPADPNAVDKETYLLPLHQKAQAATVLDHVVVEWNPQGHPPAGIYTVPHFDFHFYRISLAEQNAIPPYEVDSTGFNDLPPAGYIPSPPYFEIPGGVPEMGAHWADGTSPEFNGIPFTYTFLYGSYGGKVTFYEPMVTRAFFLSGQTADKSIPQPSLFSPVNAYYHTHYKIWQEGNKHYIALTDFTLR
jgi:hypothetical protein